MSYLDFDIEIGPGIGREYPIIVTRPTMGEVHEIMQFPFDELALENRLKDLQIALLRSGGQRRQIRPSEELKVRNFGRALFEALFIGEVHVSYVASQREAFQQGKGLRLKLHIHSPELATLPWEFLYDSNQAEYICLSNKTPVVRYLDLPQSPQPLTISSPLRILGMIVHPANLGYLDIESERLRLEKAIEDLQAKGLVELIWLQDQTWYGLQRAMRHGPWHIFHFIGHGGFDTQTNEGLIALEDATGNVHSLSASHLGRLLADHHSLRLVVLNSCEGARGSEYNIFSSTAAILVKRGIPAVLAMQYEITDRAAIELSHAFYEALVDGMPVDMAVSEARKAISLGVINSVEWGTPVLYTSLKDGTLFDIISGSANRKVPFTEPPALLGEHEKVVLSSDLNIQNSDRSIEQSNHLASSEIDPSLSPASLDAFLPTKVFEIFYSYAHEDERLRKKLETHLSHLKQEGFITGWYDRDIRAGTEPAYEIDAHLNTAHIILLLISPDFMASDYCYSIEMKRAMQRHNAKEARVIPIILRPTDWKRALFSKLQILPSNGKPISRWSDRDEAFLHVAQDIRKAVDELNAKITPETSSMPIVSSSTTTETNQQNEETNMKNKHSLLPNHLTSTISQPLPDSIFLFNQSLLDPKEFYGRARERNTLLNRTRNVASTSIVGLRRVGKTWLINYLRLVAPKELGSRFRVGYLDATTARCATIIGFTASALEALGLQEHLFDQVDQDLTRLELAVQELVAKNQIPVLSIDEFEGFGDRQVFDLHFFNALRAMTQNGLCLIIASKRPLVDIIGDYGKTSGFFNVFEQLTIRPFGPKEAERFVQSKGSQARLTDQERVRLLQLGQYRGEYWPARLQLVGKMLVEDKLLAAWEQDQDYYQPEDPNYWQEFEHRLEETYRVVIR